MKIRTVDRPYTLTFVATGQSYPLTSEEAQRLLDVQYVISATRNRVVFYETNSKRRVVLLPATRGGGVAFIIEREWQDK